MSADRSFDPRLQAYLDDELTGAERAALEAELAADSRLAADLDQLRTVNRLAHDSVPAPLPSGFEARVLAAASRVPLGPWWSFLVPSGRRPFTLLAWGLSTCTAIALIGPIRPMAAPAEEVPPPAAMPTSGMAIPVPAAPAAAPTRSVGGDRVARHADSLDASPGVGAAGTGSGGDGGGNVARWYEESAGVASAIALNGTGGETVTRHAAAASSPSPPSEERPYTSSGTSAPIHAAEEPLHGGETDDQQTFGKYLDYLRGYSPPAGAPWIDVRERYTIAVTDSAGRALPDVEVTIPAVQFAARTDAGGQVAFFPGAHGQQVPRRLEVRAGGSRQNFTRRPEGDTWRLTAQGNQPSRLALDVAFVLDTTGSMAEEINRLRDTIADVAQRVAKLPNQPKLRLGMVLYRDHGDQYLTTNIPLSANLDDFQRALADVSAGGGGDGPEDVNQALCAMCEDLRWAPAPALRMAFLIGDAPPHLDYQEPQYLETTRRAAAMGIKLFTLSSSGSDGSADDDLREYVWRQIALFTRGRFLFITKGGNGPDAGSTVHHVDRQDYTVTALPDLVVRCVSREIDALGKPPTVPPSADLGQPLRRPKAEPMPPTPVIADLPPTMRGFDWRGLLPWLLLVANAGGWYYAWRRSRQPLASSRPMDADLRWRPPSADD
mgnify:CR=1 FL=1